MNRRTRDALNILSALGFPRAQLNERSALCLLAVVGLTRRKTWVEASDPLIGITPIMDWIRDHYGKNYKPNTRETIRRQTVHQFVAVGLARYNPDNPKRPVNSPKAVYQIEPSALILVRSYGTPAWDKNLKEYFASRPTLVAQYAKARALNLVPVHLGEGEGIKLTPGDHSELIKAIIEQFAPRFVPGAVLLYAGDTGEKWGYFDQAAFNAVGPNLDTHGKMPDVVLLDVKRNWLVLVESVTSHGPVDGKRHAELATVFQDAKAGLVFVTAFPSRAAMARYLPEIAWETEVWVSEAPDHLIHFNGERFLGPYS